MRRTRRPLEVQATGPAAGRGVPRASLSPPFLRMGDAIPRRRAKKTAIVPLIKPRKLGAYEPFSRSVQRRRPTVPGGLELPETAVERVRDRFRPVQSHCGELGIAQLGGGQIHRPFEAEAGGFQEAALQLAHPADFAAEAELTDGHQAGPRRPVAFVGRDRQRAGQVSGRLGQAPTARGVDENVVPAEVEVGAPLEHGDQHVEPVEVDAVDRPARRAEPTGRGQALQLDEKRPAALERDVDDIAHLAQRAVLQERTAGVADFVHPAVAHLEDTDLVGGTKTVLLAAQDAEAVVPLPLEVEHGVDDVLEHARPGDGALLVDVAHEEDRDVAALGQQHQPAGALAHLAHAAGRRGDAAQEDRLDRIDGGHHRPSLFEMLHDAVEVVLGQHHKAVALDAKTLRPQLQLLDRLLARHVENRAVRAGHLAGELQQQGRLANAGIAADQHQGAGHDSAAQYLVELSHGEPEPVGLGKADLCQRHGLRARNADPPRARVRRRLRPDLFLDVTIPVAAFRTTADPFRRLVAALLAGEDRPRARPHARLSTPGLADVVFTVGSNYRAGLRQLRVGLHAQDRSWRRTGAWLAEIRSAPTAESRPMATNAGRPGSWMDSALVTAPASPPPMPVTGIHANAMFPAEARRTKA